MPKQPVKIESIHLCSFTSGLDELSKKQQGDLRTVLRVLAERKRFSVFEATANQTIASTMDTLGNQGYIKRTGGSYPWCEIEITEAGHTYLEEAEMPKSPIEEQISQHYRKASALAIAEVERLARAVLKQRANLGEFVMCMGSWWFTDSNHQVLDGDEGQYRYPWAKKLTDFIDEWDDYLKMTGDPMRFTADGPIRKQW